LGGDHERRDPALKPTSPESTPPRLTELARFAGCAAKISQVDLQRLERPAGRFRSARAGRPRQRRTMRVIRLRDDLALVETVDIFRRSSTTRSTTAASPPPMR